MKNWFMSKSVAVRAAVIVLAMALVVEAGLGVASLAKRSTKGMEAVAISDEAAPLADGTTIAEETQEEKEEPAAEVVKTTEEETEEVVVPVVYVKGSTDLENGDFSDGLNAWEVYSFVEDNISVTAEDYFDIEMNETGSEDWHVQLKQTGVRLESGKWYVVSFDAKSSINRTIACAMQRDGMIHDDDWTPYANATVFSVSNNWRNCTMVFKMPEKTDDASVISFSLGAVEGVKINKTHSVSIDNVSLKKLPDNWTDSLKEGDNLIGNPRFEYSDTLWESSVVAPGAAKVSFANNKATYAISNPGSVDWHVQLKQAGLKLENNTGYRLTFKASSSVARTIKTGFMDTSYVNWYGGGDVDLTADEKEITVDFYNSIASDDNAVMMISMGKLDGVNTPASTITLSDFKLVKCDEVGPSAGGNGGGYWPSPITNLSDGWFVYDDGCSHVLYATENNGEVTIGMRDTGTEDWHVQLQKKNNTLVKGKYYKVSFDAKASLPRKFSNVIQRDGSADDNWIPYTPGNGIDSLGTEWKTFEKTFCMNEETDANAIFNFSFGTIAGKRISLDHSVSVRNIKFEQVEEPTPPSYDYDDEMLINNEFDEGGNNWETNVDAAAGARVSFKGGKAVFNISNTGNNSWDVQLKQNNINLEKGESYVLSIDASSSVARDIKLDFLKTNYDWITGTTVTLDETANTYTYNFTMTGSTVSDAVFTVSMGNLGTPKTVASKITINSISLKKIESFEEEGLVIELEKDPEVTDHDQYKGGIDINPADYVADYSGKNLKVTATLKASMYFGGAICGSTESGWHNGTKQQADAPGTYVWEETLEAVNGTIRVDIWWSGAPSIVLTDIQIVEATDDPETSDPGENDKWIVELSEDPEVPGQYKGGVEIDPADYVDDYVGKDYDVTVKFVSSAYCGGAISGNTANGWFTGTQIGEDNAGEHTWKQTINELTGVVKFDLWWSGASTVEILEVSFAQAEEETEEPAEPEKWLVYAEGNKGEAVLNPADFGLTDYQGKDVKISVVLESTAVFNGAIGGTTLAEGGWSQSGTFESADGSEMTWTHTIPAYNDFSKVEFYWIGGEYVEIKSVSMEIIAAEEPAEPEKWLVYADGNKGEAVLNPADFGLTDYQGKDVKITVVLQSTAVFNGAIGGTTLAEGGWSQSGTFESADGSEMTWTHTIPAYNDFSKVEFYWIGGEYVEIKSVSMEIVGSSNDAESQETAKEAKSPDVSEAKKPEAIVEITEEVNEEVSDEDEEIIIIETEE